MVVVGRADDVLNVGGVKFSPAPIEAQIRTIDGITDTALLSIDGANQAATLLVAIETANGEVPPGLVERINPIVSPYQRTFELAVMQRFPRTETGKLKRKELAANYLQARTRSRKT